MNIKILEDTDNIQDYIDCIKDLNNINVPTTSIEEIVKNINERPDNIITFILVEDKRIVATSTIIMEKKLRYKQLCCHIEDVGVHPHCRGKGYGKKIVKYCIKVAQINNCYKVKLNCNDNLIQFYFKLGFVQDGKYMVAKF
jgi:glucosamine-phosphate N-acetyltransferase